MAAIITDQLRILNAKNFVSSVQDTSNSYYAWIGLPDATDFQRDWNTNPPAPRDSLDDSNFYWDTMIALKKINPGDVSQVDLPKDTKSGLIDCLEFVDKIKGVKISNFDSSDVVRHRIVRDIINAYDKRKK